MEPELGFVNLLSTEDVLDDLCFAADNGFKWFELALDWQQNVDLPDEVLDRIRDIASQHDIRLIVHTPYYLPTSCLQPEIRDGLMAYMHKAVTIAGHIRSDRLTIHCGWKEIPGPSAGLCLEFLINNLKAIVEIGCAHDVNICLENSPSYELLLCDNLAHYMKVLTSVDGLKATLDVGHAHTSRERPEAYVAKVREQVMDMHIHDNNGQYDEHKCPGQGSLDFISLLEACKHAGYYGPFMLELFPYENILKGKEVFLDLWDKA